MLPGHFERRLIAGHANPKAPKPRCGEDIFSGDAEDYPRNWGDFIGQAKAVEHVRAHIRGARARNKPMDHILLASGVPGIGKTSMAQLIAYEYNSGFVPVSGALTVEDARAILTSMADHDILFWDEFHLAVQGNRNRADWMLPFLQGGELMTRNGAERMPAVTVIAATTDLGKLPSTIISRFMVQPTLVPYTTEEAVQIAQGIARKVGIRLRGERAWERIVTAANHNPRAMRKIIIAARDQASLDGKVHLGKAFEWAGVTTDGLTRESSDILLVLLGSDKNTASLETISSTLGEPGPLRHHEQVLLQRGYITIGGRGRTLTESGLARAVELVEERRKAA